MSRPEVPGPGAALEALVRMALSEDVGPGDVTTAATVPASTIGSAVVVAKEELVVAGLDAAEAVFRAVDRGLAVEPAGSDGMRASTGEVVLSVSGPLGPMLTAERTALNFLQRLSGIATLARRFVDAAHGTGVRILDTRKTTPGWRALEKEAVRAGGAFNHRMGLHDFVLVKDNHIAAAGGIRAAVERVRAHPPAAGLTLSVEVTSLEELAEALDVGVDRVLLDNMTTEEMARAVERTHALGTARPELEASGNVTLAHVRAVAETGVDWISVGALTHSAPAADLSLRVR